MHDQHIATVSRREVGRVVENIHPCRSHLPNNHLSYNLLDGKSTYNSQLVHESVHNTVAKKSRSGAVSDSR